MEVKLLLKYLKMNLKAMAEFRLDFFINNISMIFTNVVFMGALIYLAYSIGGIGFLSFEEVFIAFAIANLAFFIGMNFFVGIRDVQDIVINGELDRLLIRPISTYLHILIYRLNPYAFAEIFTGIVFLIFIDLSYWPFVLIMSIFGGIIMNVTMFYLNLIPMFFDMNKSVNLFDMYITFQFNPPLVFNPFLKFIAMFVIPGGIIGFGPVIALHYNYWWLILISFGIFSVLMLELILYLGLKNYKSAGY